MIDPDPKRPYWIIPGAFYHHWVYKKNVGETDSFWKMQSPVTGEVKRLSKRTADVVACFASPEAASHAVIDLNNTVAEAQKRFHKTCKDARETARHRGEADTIAPSED